ncbi:MAG: 2-oxo acid dehydrogenase subunit E2 [Anaerolineae bacterium]|nr:2-oxo acid dehydrogenase subunit E2 [Anaerolineae bacterium]
MAELIIMPKLGFDMQEGQLINWLKKPGDVIAEGDVVAEIESDKATIEVEVFQTGTILELLVQVEDWVPVGAPIAVIGAPGEQYDLAALGVQSAAPKAATSAPAVASTPAEAAAPAAAAPAPVTSAEDNGYPGGVKASPLARKMAADMGVALGGMAGTGPGGRIVRKDIEAFKQQMGTAPAMPVAPASAAPVFKVPGAQPAASRTQAQPAAEDTVTPLTRMRSRIAERMIESKSTVPHFYVTVEIDMGPALDLRKQVNDRLEKDGVKVSVNDMIVKAVALALREFPNLNASFNGDSIIHRASINVGIAVALEGGLLNVVSKNADSASLAKMAVAHKEMVDRAREGKVKPEDLEGETFAVSNLGPYDVDSFVAIINPPASGILAVGSAKQVPVVNSQGHLDIGWRMKATVSADHRVTDGAEAARFTQRIKQILEDPFRLLI